MRSLQEIQQDIGRAASINDAHQLTNLAKEVLEHQTDEAAAASAHAWGIVSTLAGKNKEALEYYDKAVDLLTKVGDLARIARVRNGIGNVYLSTGKYSEALEQYERAHAAFSELGDKVGMAEVSNGIGVVLQLVSDYPRALERFERSLTLNQEAGNSIGAARALSNMADVYQFNGEYPRALAMFEKALQMCRDETDKFGEAAIINSIGGLNELMGDHPKAMEAYYKSRELHEKNGDGASVAGLTGNIINVMLRTERFDEAESLIEEQSSMVMDDPEVRAIQLMSLAAIHEHREDLDSARTHLLQSLKISEDVGLRGRTVEAHDRLRALAQKMNDFEGYIHHNAEYLRLNEEIRGKEATQKLAVMEAERKMENERRQHEKERALLYGALPEAIATRMLQGEDVSGDQFERASVLFLDIAGFTQLSDRMSPSHVVQLLKAIFKICDDVCKEYGITKIKTIGDSYMAVGGVPEPLEDQEIRTAKAAVEMLNRLNEVVLGPTSMLGDDAATNEASRIAVRIGLHSGPLVAGIVGEERLQYDIWGDTVNVASRMESTGEPGRIQVSELFAHTLDLTSQNLVLIPRGSVEIKGKGLMKTFWLEGAN